MPRRAAIPTGASRRATARARSAGPAAAGRGLRCGRELRPTMPADQACSYRTTHRLVVGQATWNTAGAEETVQPSSTTARAGRRRWRESEWARGPPGCGSGRLQQLHSTLHKIGQSDPVVTRPRQTSLVSTTLGGPARGR
jgi:hypothetical protein